MINMLSWWQWAILAAIPPAITALYFLKLRRRPVEVPSTYLWKKTVEDLHVNSLWQKLRKSLLLLLQLLLIGLVMIAVLRPGWSGSEMSGSRFIFLIDNSASMNATDVEPTRLHEAKRQVAELIERMESGDEAMIIAFSNIAHTVQSYTDNQRLLLRQLETIQPTHRTTTIDEALVTAASLANPGQSGTESQDTAVADALPARLFIFSDGRFPDVENFALGNLYPSDDQKPVYVPIGSPEAANVAIVAFSARRAADRADRLRAFARIENHGGQDAEVVAELFLNDELDTPQRAVRVSVPAGKSKGVPFDLPDLEEARLQLRISGGGALDVDDVAWTTISRRRLCRVLLATAGNEQLEAALTTPHLKKVADVTIIRPDELPAYDQPTARGQFELVVYDDCTPPADPDAAAENQDGQAGVSPAPMPQANTLFLGRLPPLANWSAEAIVQGPQIIDVQQAHPIMSLIDMGDVAVAEGMLLKPPPGSTVLIRSEAGPLMAIAPRGGFEDLVLGVALREHRGGVTEFNTDWPKRRSFPTFVDNVVNYLGRQGRAGEENTRRPGSLVELHGGGGSEELNVTTPSGREVPVVRSNLGTFDFTEADEVGVYAVRENGTPVDHFAVNLFSSAESNIKPRSDDPVRIGHVDVEAHAGWQSRRLELWKLVLLAALGVLLFEWYIYNRRVYL